VRRTGAALVLLMLAACATAQRPAGLVERWLLSLNQGSAGRPGVYAPAAVSDQVLLDRDRLDPGALDVIEVGRSSPGEGGIEQVPFRVVTVDGDEIRAVADVRDGRIIGIISASPTSVGPLPSEGGPGIEPVPATDWLVATGLAGSLILFTWMLMWVVRRTPKHAGDG